MNSVLEIIAAHNKPDEDGDGNSNEAHGQKGIAIRNTNTDSVLLGQTGFYIRETRRLPQACDFVHRLGLQTVRRDSIIGTFVPFSSSSANHMLCSCAALEQCASTVLPRDEWSA